MKKIIFIIIILITLIISIIGINILFLGLENILSIFSYSDYYYPILVSIIVSILILLLIIIFNREKYVIITIGIYTLLLMIFYFGYYFNGSNVKEINDEIFNVKPYTNILDETNGNYYLDELNDKKYVGMAQILKSKEDYKSNNTPFGKLKDSVNNNKLSFDELENSLKYSNCIIEGSKDYCDNKSIKDFLKEIKLNEKVIKYYENYGEIVKYINNNSNGFRQETKEFQDTLIFSTLAKLNAYYIIYYIENNQYDKAFTYYYDYNTFFKKLLEGESLVGMISGMSRLNVLNNHIEYIIDNYNIGENNINKLRDTFVQNQINSEEIWKKQAIGEYRAGLNNPPFVNFSKNNYNLLYDNKGTINKLKLFTLELIKNKTNIAYKEFMNNFKNNYKKVFYKRDFLGNLLLSRKYMSLSRYYDQLVELEKYQNNIKVKLSKKIIKKENILLNHFKK